MGMVETSDTNGPNSTGFVPDTIPRPKEPFHLVADCTRRRRLQEQRLQELQQVVTNELAAPYTVKYLPDSGQIVLAPETRVVVAVPLEPTMEERLIMAIWWIPSLHLSRTESRYLVGGMAYGMVWDQVYGMLRQLALPESRAFTAYMGDDTTIHGAACYLPDYIGHLFKCQPPPPSDIMQPGDRRLHWLPIAVDGTSRHEATYVHYTLGGTASPNQPSSWRLLGGKEKWQTLYAACQEIDFDDEFRKAATVSFNDAKEMIGSPFFFCVQTGKHRCSWRAATSRRQNPLVPPTVSFANWGLICLCYLFQIVFEILPGEARPPAWNDRMPAHPPTTSMCIYGVIKPLWILVQQRGTTICLNCVLLCS